MVIKMDTAGHNVWVQHSDNSGTVNASQVAICGDTVGVFGMYATQMMAWGTDTLTRPMNCGYRAYFTRLKAGTGAIIAVDSLWGPCGTYVNPTTGGGMAGGGTGAIASDPFGNFYMGGNFNYQMAAGADTLVNIGGDYNWYVCKFGTANCTQPIGTAVHQLANSAGHDLIVYPNPSQGSFTFSSTAALGRLCVYNLLGDCVYTKLENGTHVTVDLAAQPKGIYLYALQDDLGNIVRGKLMLR
jgi:hypothetical protein